MRLKGGVEAKGIQPEIILAIIAAQHIYTTNGYGLVITSLLDGKHSVNSLHYKGLAVDLRIRHLPKGAATLITSQLAESLGDEFDVILEDDHIHVEFDP